MNFCLCTYYLFRVSCLNFRKIRQFSWLTELSFLLSIFRDTLVWEACRSTLAHTCHQDRFLAGTGGLCCGICTAPFFFTFCNIFLLAELSKLMTFVFVWVNLKFSRKETKPTFHFMTKKNIFRRHKTYQNQSENVQF